jgi:hypothetical protein
MFENLATGFNIGQVKLDSDKWKLGKNLFEIIENLSKFGFWTSR